MKVLALDKIIFKLGDEIIHRNLGYTAKITKLFKNGGGQIKIHNTPENCRIWHKLASTKHDYLIKVVDIPRTFKHNLFTLNL